MMMIKKNQMQKYKVVNPLNSYREEKLLRLVPAFPLL